LKRLRVLKGVTGVDYRIYYYFKNASVFVDGSCCMGSVAELIRSEGTLSFMNRPDLDTTGTSGSQPSEH
jgi:hypothetical protein